MINVDQIPYIQTLDDGLILRTAATKDDVERVAEFNGLIHGRGVVEMTLDLFLRHPHTCGRDLIYVDDTQSRQVVSSLCLIPWVLSCENATFKSGEMGIVGTLEPYRRRGLIREQVTYFNRRLQERGCVLSHIQGIWNYYRQFGYEYAMPLDGGLRLSQRDVPKRTGAQYHFRLATFDDLPALMTLFDTAAHEISIHTVRDADTWRYLLENNPNSEMVCETWVVTNADQQIVGYFRLPEHHFGEELTVNEASSFSFDIAWEVLLYVAALAETRKTPGVRLCLAPQSDLMRVARSFGAFDMGTYAWQIHMPDYVAFLRAISPALEQRLSRSIFAQGSYDLTLSFYRQSIRLRMEQARLVQIEDLGFGDKADVHMPPLAFIPLALGYRSFDEQHASFPDMGVSASHKLLVDTLFPSCSSFLYTNY